MIDRVKGDRNKPKFGSSKEQEIEGVPTIEYGWIDKLNRKVFFSVLGFHCRAAHEQPIKSTSIELRLKKIITRKLLESFSDLKFVIVDVSLPELFNVRGKAFLSIEVMVHSREEIVNDRIERLNEEVVELVRGIKEISIHKTNKC